MMKSVIIIVIILSTFGKGKRMKYSKQRELIYKTVMENPVHPSADMVYEMVRKELPNISLGTVYRNLNLLSQQGALQKISMPNASDHFDGRVEEHCHMLCDKCGHVCDIDTPGLEDFTQRLSGQSDFQVTGCHIYFTGICGVCMRGAQEKESDPGLLA